MVKQLYVEELGLHVQLVRRKGTRNLRISIKSDGTVRLSVPYAVSERRAQKFLLEKADWILKHHTQKPTLTNGNHIGKSHRLVITYNAVEKPKTRLRANEIVITLPHDVSETDTAAQEAIIKASERALKKEAEALLPQRLEQLSQKNSIPYRSVKIKKLKSRWGSCDSFKNITLNIYLMQLDWNLIDYVLLHELVHTIHQHHQTDYWNYLESILPDYKARRKALKSKPTNVVNTKF